MNQQLPDPISATAIAENPELLPSSPILIEFNDGSLLHAYSGEAEVPGDEPTPCAALEFRGANGAMVSVVLDLDGLFALGETVDKLLDEVAEDEGEDENGEEVG